MNQHQPRIRFLVGGVQKAGTTALAAMLARHPGIALPDRLPRGATAPGGDMSVAYRKEAHVFDAPDFDDRWDAAAVDARFAARFSALDDERLQGDATPLSLYHPRVLARVRRYNPDMRWIVLLRDPVERAISHYFMERSKGREPLTLWRAVLAEPRRLRGGFEDMSRNAAWRRASYADRGRYTRQLDLLYAHFPAEQVLLLRSTDLERRPVETAQRAIAFLGLPGLPIEAPSRRVLEGDYRRPPAWSPARLLLRWRLRGELARLRARYGIELAAD